MEHDTGSNNLSALVLNDDINAEVAGFEFYLAVLNLSVDFFDVLVLDVDRLAALCDLIRNINDFCFIFCNTVTSVCFY